MVETVCHGLPIAAAIVPNRTRELHAIDDSHATEIVAYTDDVKEATGRNYHLTMSEGDLARKAVDGNYTDAPWRPYDPLQPRFSARVLESIDDVMKDYGTAFFYPYTQTPHAVELSERTGMELVGPRLDVKEELNDKTTVYQDVKERGVNVPEGEVVSGVDEAVDVLLGEDWEDGAFVSAEGGAGGSGATHAETPEDIYGFFGRDYDDGDLLMVRWIDDIRSAPNVFVLIDDSGPHILSASDQIIADGTDYRGNTYPLNIDDTVREEVHKQCEAVAEYMWEKGYRTTAGIDGITTDDTFYFVEINPRRNHSTVMNTVMLEEARPDDMPPLPLIEAEISLGYDKSYDFDEWAERVDDLDVTWDMFVFQRPEWARLESLPLTLEGRDHSWDFSSSYITNIPAAEGTVAPKSYGTPKSGGHSRRATPNELGRIVTTDPATRSRVVSDVERHFSFFGDGQ
ncbi:MAG: ATP-grasp domain-containing protein [Halobacteriales archaeon]